MWVGECGSEALRAFPELLAMHQMLDTAISTILTDQANSSDVFESLYENLYCLWHGKMPSIWVHQITDSFWPLKVVSMAVSSFYLGLSHWTIGISWWLVIAYDRL